MHVEHAEEGTVSADAPADWLADPRWRAHADQVHHGEITFGNHRGDSGSPKWADIGRRRRRLELQCRHGLRGQDAPRTEIGGVTSDRLYDLEGPGRLLTSDRPASLTCPRCQRKWVLAPKAGRAGAVVRFREDPTVRVLLGTRVLERGIDGLQHAAVLLTLGSSFNPAREDQRVGRLRRPGSPHALVRHVTFLAETDHERRKWCTVQRRAADSRAVLA